MVQVPTVMPVTMLPLTVQTPAVVEVNLTGLPEPPPVADAVPVPPKFKVGAAPKLIVWLPLPMLTVCLAWGAAS